MLPLNDLLSTGSYFSSGLLFSKFGASFFILQMMKRLDIFDAPGESNLGDYTHKNQNNICICLYTSHNYRPQTKFAKVMFSQASFCPRGWGGLLHREGWCAPPGGWGLGRPPPHLDTTGYGQRAGGTHRTGMHSCFL